jgi:hypothetical protein
MEGKRSLFVFLYFYYFYIYLHVYTSNTIQVLFGPPPPPPTSTPLLGRTCSAFLFPEFVEEITRKHSVFASLLVWAKDKEIPYVASMHLCVATHIKLELVWKTDAQAQYGCRENVSALFKVLWGKWGMDAPPPVINFEYVLGMLIPGSVVCYVCRQSGHSSFT